MFEEGASYPLAGENVVGRILIGSLLVFGSFLVIPLFLLFGYLVRVLAATANGEEEPPAFEDWGGMLVDGVKGSVVTLVYGFIPFVLIAVSFGIGAGGAGSGNDAAAGILGGIGIIGMLLSFVALFVLYYLVPAALTNMAVEGSLGAAFDFGRLKGVLLSADYLVAWIIPFIIAFAAQMATGLLVTITFGFGIILVPTIQFYVNVAVFFMFGKAFGKVTGVTPAQTSSVADAA